MADGVEDAHELQEIGSDDETPKESRQASAEGKISEEKQEKGPEEIRSE